MLEGTCSLPLPFPTSERGPITVSIFRAAPWWCPMFPHPAKYLQAVSVGWGTKVVVETRDRHPCLEGFLNYI